MADVEVNSGLAPDDDTGTLRMAKGRLSYNGLHVISGQIQEDCNADLRWPYCIETYKIMCKDATISPALNMMEMAIAKTKWVVKIPEGYEEELKEKAKFLEQCKDDMEHSWVEFIRQASTFNRYGFAPVEKVYRKRLKSQGSRYNDGLYGIRSLPLISQDSVNSWMFEKGTGRKLTGLKQEVNIPTSSEEVRYSSHGETVEIPRSKFMLFRADPVKDSPIGTSPLNSVYVAWRYKTELEKHEAISVSQDLRGLKVIKIPPRYLSKDATPEEVETREHFQEILRSLHKGEQSGLLIPNINDDTGKPMFEFQLMSVMGQVANDVDKIITRWRKEIITGIMAPQLILGQDGSGSFALSESLESVTNIVIESRLQEIKDQLNHDLVRQLFQLNGWNTEVMPYFEFAETKEANLGDLSSFLQRVGAIGGLSLTAEMVNWIHEQIGAPVPFDDIDIDIEEVRQMTTGFESNSGEGMAVGTTGNGTAKSSSSRDNSVANNAN